MSVVAGIYGFWDNALSDKAVGMNKQQGAKMHGVSTVETMRMLPICKLGM